MANFTALAAARHAVLRRVGWDVEEARARRRAADPGHRRGRCPRVVAQRAALCRPGAGAGRAHPCRRRGPDGPDVLARCPRRPVRTDHRLRPARRGEHRRVRSDDADRGRGPRSPERLAPCRRRVRVVGGGQPPAAAARRRVRRRRFLGDRCPQMAQRAVRLRAWSSSATPPRIGRRWVSARPTCRWPTASNAIRSNGSPSCRGAAAAFPIYAAIRSLGATASRRWSNGAATWRPAWPAAWPNRPDVRIVNEVVLNQVLLSSATPRSRPMSSPASRPMATLWLGGSTFHGDAGDPDLGLGLEHPRGRHRPVGRRDPRGHRGRRGKGGPVSPAGWIVTDVIATGSFGRSRPSRGADTILSTTSRPFVTDPNSV